MTIRNIQDTFSSVLSSVVYGNHEFPIVSMYYHDCITLSLKLDIYKSDMMDYYPDMENARLKTNKYKK